MIATLLLCARAHAAPPLPVWRDDDDVADDDPDPFRGERDLDGSARTSPQPLVAKVVCDSGDVVSGFHWADPANAVVSLPGLETGAVGRTAWLRVTARIDGAVVMWQQGPYVDDGVTLEQGLVMDGAALDAASEADGAGELTAAVVVLDLDGRPVTTAVLPRLVWWLGIGGNPEFSLRSKLGWLRDSDDTVSADL